MKIHPTVRSTLVIACGLLTGCAVLTVEVDVYKGPLANQREVVVEQTAAMAIAAKPLLIQLRDSIECETRRREKDLCYAQALEQFRCSKDYRRGYMDPGNCRITGFYDDRAERVNAILGLYRDLDPLLEMAGDITLALEEYLRAIEALDSGLDELKSYWAKNCDKAFLKSSDPDFSPVQYGRLRDGYRSFFFTEAYSEKQNSRVLTWITEYCRTCGELKIPKMRGEADRWGFNKEFTDDSEDPFNWAFSALADPDMVGKHAGLLFPKSESEPDHERNKEFVSKIVVRASAFLQARGQLSKILESSLKILLQIGSVSENRLSQSQKNRITELIRGVVLQVIGPNRVVEALEKNKSELRTKMSKQLASQLLNPKNVLDHKHWNYTKETCLDQITRFVYDNAVLKSLETLLADDPPTIADQLLRLHLLEKQSGAFPSKAHRRFGLARGPSMPQVQLDHLRQTIAQAGYQVKVIASEGVFDRGRMTLGLETLVEKYLAIRQKNGNPPRLGTDEDETRALNSLLDALIHFAEKVVFVANNDRLLNTTLADSFSLDDRQKAYVRTLQVVENSILVQVDELRSAGKWDADRKKSLQREVKALAATLGPWVERVKSSIVATQSRADELAAGLTRLKQAKGKVVPDEKKSEKIKARALLEEIKKEVPDLTAQFREALTSAAAEITGEAEREKVFARIREIIETGKLKEMAHLEALKSGQAEMAALEAMGRTGQFDGEEKGHDPKWVIDLLIATLNFLRIEAAATHGEKSDEFKQLTAALEIARQRRAEMVYIRPPSVYLRTSAPASFTQRGSSANWKNELGNQWIHSIPGSEWFSVNGSLMDRLTQDEIDKQFWQRINSVRVAGGGNTNFVIAKDDVGNWYVKNYSADPEPIIRGAANLARFGLGAALKTNLLTTPLLKPPGTTGTPQAASGTQEAETESPLGKVFARHQKDFDDGTKKDYEDLLSRIDKLKDGVKSALKDMPKSGDDLFKSQVDGAAKALGAEINEVKKTSGSGSGEKIVDLLWALKRYHGDLTRRIEARTLDILQENEVKKNAKEMATRLIRDLLKEFIDRRKSSLQDYESALKVIGEAAQPK